MRRKAETQDDSREPGLIIIGRETFRALALDDDDTAYLRAQFVRQACFGQCWIFRRSERADRLLGLER